MLRPDPKLSHVDVRSACETLAAIAATPPQDSSYWHQLFPYGGLALDDELNGPIHRCLSAPEAKAKLGAIKRQTGCALRDLLAEWDQLSAATLLTLQTVVLSRDPQERQQAAVGQSEDWARLDELLFRLWFTAWLSSGMNFVPAPRPAVVVRQISISADAYKGCLKRLRDELACPTHEDCEPRVDLWLGDPPRDEAGAQAPRLWVSGRAHHWPASEGAKHGLLPANTHSQAQAARAAIYRRWLDRDEDALDQGSSDELPLQFTQCRRCGKWLGIDGPPGVRRDV